MCTVTDICAPLSYICTYIVLCIVHSDQTAQFELNFQMRFLFNQRVNRRQFIIITKHPYGYKKFCDGREKGSHWEIVSHEGAIGERLERAIDFV